MNAEKELKECQLSVVSCPLYVLCQLPGYVSGVETVKLKQRTTESFDQYASPRRMTGRVRRMILRSSRSDQFSM